MITNDITEKVGLTFEPYQFTIERGKIKEFVLAIGDDNEIYYDVEKAKKAGFRDIPIPPTFPTVIDMWAGPNLDKMVQKLEIDPLKALHGEMGYKYIAHICAGDEIIGKARVTAAETKKTMNLFTVETEYFNQLGELVLISRSIVIEKH